jgi:hypothetical protein
VVAVSFPDYNRESVYASDVKKMVTWYNILIENNIDLDEEEVEVNDEKGKEEGKGEKEGEEESESKGE